MWFYAIAKKKHTSIDGNYKEYSYEIHEYYPATKEYEEMWTENAIAPFGETIEELEKTLELMLSDVKRRRKIIDLTNDTK